MHTCSECHADNTDAARFCSRCGAELSSEPSHACSACGREVAPDAKFCPSCGHALEAGPRGDERKLVTILFADLTGSTTLGERLDPEALKEVVHTYFRAMREEIEAEGGTVEKFIGDAVMAAFGAPITHEDDPSRALRTAVKMRRRLATLNETLIERHGVTLQMRIGINTGEVLADPDPRADLGMLSGDAVNVAARLEQSAAPGQIVISERTARATTGFVLRPLGPLSVRGREQAVAAVELVEAGPDSESATQRGIPGLHAPMVGRDNEIEFLRLLYKRVASESRAHLVTIYGDAGIGKSRLVREFTRWITENRPGTAVVVGRCLPYGQGVTYWPLAEIMKNRAGVLNSDTADEALQKIRYATAGPLAASPDPRRSAAAIAFSFGLEDSEVQFAELSPRQVRSEAHEAWREFFAGTAAASPVVAIVEDIHWADPALHDLLEDIAERTQGPLLLVCPARHDLIERRPTWGGGKRNFSNVALEPLPAEAAKQLVGSLLAVDDLPEAVRLRILSRAEGNPFFLEEIVRHLMDEGRIVRVGNAWRATSDIGDAIIPDSVQAVLAARIDLLKPEEKRVVRAASVVGRTFWLGPLNLLAGTDIGTIDDILASLEKRDLILERPRSTIAGDREYNFKHVLTRDVAYKSLPSRERGTAHAQVAGWIEGAAGERHREFADLLAHHYMQAYESSRDAAPAERAELRAKTFRYLLLASGEARTKMLLERSQGLAEQALVLAETAEDRSLAHEALGLTALYAYRGDDAWRSLTRSVDERLAMETPDSEYAAAVCARAVESPTRWPASMDETPAEGSVARYVDIGMRHAGTDTEARIRLLIARSFWPFAYGREGFTGEEAAEACSAGEEAVAAALRIGRPDLASAALDGVGSIDFISGRHGRSLETSERRLKIVKTLSDPWEIGDALGSSADLGLLTGRYRDAAAWGLDGFERSATGPSVWVACFAWKTIAQFRLGDWDSFMEDLAMLEDMASAPLPNRSPYYLSATRAVAAFAHEVRGNSEAADAAARSVATLKPYGLVRAFPWIARMHAWRGDLRAAHEVLDRQDLAVGRDLAFEARCDLVIVGASWGDANSVLREARAWASESGSVALPIYADRLDGAAAIETGDHAYGQHMLEAAAIAFAGLGARWEAARTQLILGEGQLKDDPVSARTHLQAALGVFEELHSVREEARARAALAVNG